MSRRAGRPLHVLVVDDYADNRQMYAKFLRFKGLKGHLLLQMGLRQLRQCCLHISGQVLSLQCQRRLCRPRGHQ